MDAATGLLYVGNGQYYNPATGRFLTRDARSDQTNPYVPWKADASALLIAPLVLLSLVYSRRRGKRTRWDSLLIMVVLSVSVSMSLAVCSGGQLQRTTHTVTITQSPFGTVVALDGTDIGSVGTPAGTPSDTPNVVCTMIFTPIRTMNDFLAEYDITIEESAKQPNQKSEWTQDRMNAVLQAAEKIGYRLKKAGESTTAVFTSRFEPLTITWCTPGDRIGTCGIFAPDAKPYGYTPNKNHIYFWRLSGEIYGWHGAMARNVVHELGHVDLLTHTTDTMPDYHRDQIFVQEPDNIANYQQHPCWLDVAYPEGSKPCNMDGEMYADIFVAWAYDAWNTDIRYEAPVKSAQDWISNRMSE
jgi:hypothetical protein